MRHTILIAVVALAVAALAACGDDVLSAESNFITVTVSATGSAFDPDGFQVLVDGDSLAWVDLDGAVSVLVPGGAHRVALGGVSPNCDSGGEHSVRVDVGVQPHVRIQVSCEAPPELHDVRFVFEAAGDLVAMNADGTSRTLILSGPGLHEPDVSPDGTRVAARIDAPGEVPGLLIANIDGTGVAMLALGDARYARWSPDGSRIAYWGKYPTECWAIWGDWTECHGLAVKAVDGSSIDWLTVEDPINGGGQFWPTWSPDGSALVVDSGNQQLVFRIASDGTTSLQSITPGSLPVWAPDGRITYVALALTAPYTPDLMSIEPDGSGRTLLRRMASTSGPHPSDWSPDGRYLLYTDARPSGGRDIYLLDVATDGVYRLTADGASLHPSFLSTGG